MSTPGARRSDPAELGFRMPAEWEPHRATWFSWPHNTETWPDALEQVESVLVEAVAAICSGEEVFINVLDAEHERHVRALLGGVQNAYGLRFFRIPTNDAWARDHGPIFVTRGEGATTEVAATVWRFNSWGRKYPPWELDDHASSRMAEAAEVPIFDGGIVLEGGSIEPNGAGTLLTTDACLLNPNRERRWSRKETEVYLGRYLGAQNLIWLGDGITGDDTDGHIDDLARFVAVDIVVAVTEDDPEDPNHLPLTDNLDRLRRAVLADGRQPEIVTLPCPRPVYLKGERLPASYANFYVCNSSVLVPVFADAADDTALATIQRLFPTRRVVPLYSRDVVWGLGAIHCLTQQVPLGSPARMHERPQGNGSATLAGTAE